MSLAAWIVSVHTAAAQVGSGDGSLEADGLRWVAGPEVSSVHEPFGVMFVPRYPDLVVGSSQRDADLEALIADLPQLRDARLEGARARVSQRLEAVQYWQGRFAALVADTSVEASRRRAASDLHQRLALEASTLELQLDMLGQTRPSAWAPAMFEPGHARRERRENREITVEAADQEMVRIGADLLITPDQVVETAVVIGGDMRVEGRVLGDVVAVFGNIVVAPSGRVDGDTVVVLGSLQADTRDHFRSFDVLGGEAQFSNDEQDRPETPREARSSGWGLGAWVARIVSTLTLAGLGALAAGMFPDAVDRVADALERRPGWSVFLGAIGVPGFLLGAGMLAITLIGAPVALVVLAVLGASLVLGLAASSQLLGEQVHRAAASLAPVTWSQARWFSLGALALLVANATSLPWFLFLPVIFAVIAGAGAAMGSRLGRARPG